MMGHAWHLILFLSLPPPPQHFSPASPSDNDDRIVSIVGIVLNVALFVIGFVITAFAARCLPTRPDLSMSLFRKCTTCSSMEGRQSMRLSETVAVAAARRQRAREASVGRTTPVLPLTNQKNTPCCDFATYWGEVWL